MNGGSPLLEMPAAIVHAPRAKASPSRRDMTPNLASQMRVAFSSMAWNTGSSSPGDLDDASTSEVAVCCSSASVSSRVRACIVEQALFSIAITACAAKVLTSSICLSVKGSSARAGQDQYADGFLPGAAGPQERPACHQVLCSL